MAMEIGKAYQIEDIGRNQKENTWVILQITLGGNVMEVTKYIKENGIEKGGRGRLPNIEQ